MKTIGASLTVLKRNLLAWYLWNRYCSTHKFERRWCPQLCVSYLLIANFGWVGNDTLFFGVRNLEHIYIFALPRTLILLLEDWVIIISPKEYFFSKLAIHSLCLFVHKYSTSMKWWYCVQLCALPNYGLCLISSECTISTTIAPVDPECCSSYSH